MEHSADEGHYEHMTATDGRNAVEERKELAILEDEYKLFLVGKLGLIITLILIVILLLLFRGTKKFKSIVGVPYCDVVYWLILAVQILACIIAFIIHRSYLIRILQTKRKHNVVAQPGEFEMAEEYISKLTILSLVAGVLAGILGIGDGMVMSLTLLSMGVPALSLGATSGFFVVQTSFLSLFQSVLYGDVPFKDQAFFFRISLVGSFVVSFFLTWLVRKLNHHTYYCGYHKR